MRKTIHLIVAALLLIGCAGNTFDASNDFDDAPQERYRWNQSSGRAGEGRCHAVRKDGSLGKFVPSEYCGR